MVCCIKCTNVIDDENEQYYVIGDMGPEIIFLLEQNHGQQVGNKKNISIIDAYLLAFDNDKLFYFVSG